jgi:hypothetical protein
MVKQLVTCSSKRLRKEPLRPGQKATVTVECATLSYTFALWTLAGLACCAWSEL